MGRIGLLEVAGFVVSVVVLAGSAREVTARRIGAAPWRVAPGTILIEEVEYDTDQPGNDSAYEWFELYNPNDDALTLSGWRIADGSDEDVIPSLTIAGHGFAIVAATTQFHINYPTVPGPIVYLQSPIGNGLDNAGDRLLLRDPDGTEIDALSWGSDPGVFNPPAPVVPRGHSLERLTPGLDTNTAADWTNRYPPTPGRDGSGGATPTPTPTALAATPTPTPTATPAPVTLNEVLPAPATVDWNGNGVADQNDEYIELYNRSAAPVDLSGWQLDDLASGGTLPYTIPGGSQIAPGGFLLFFRSETGVALNNSGNEQVRLLAPGGIQVEEFWYNNSTPDWPYSKTADGGTVWTGAYPPSPGATNQAAPCYDFNQNGQVDTGDLQAVAERWYDAATFDPLYDVVPDGLIDVLDVMTVAAAWGQLC